MVNTVSRRMVLFAEPTEVEAIDQTEKQGTDQGLQRTNVAAGCSVHSVEPSGRFPPCLLRGTLTLLLPPVLIGHSVACPLRDGVTPGRSTALSFGVPAQTRLRPAIL